VERAFPAPGPGWPFARFHSPDVMIAARSPDEVQRDDCLLVLGEIHVASNTLGTPGFLAQHPCANQLRRAADADMPEPRLEVVMPRSFWPVARTRPSLVSAKDFRLQVSAEPGSDADPSPTTLPVGACVVCRDGRRLVIRTRDGRHQFDAVTVLAQAMSRQVSQRFAIVSPLPHCPRVTFDRLVVVREFWSFPPGDLSFASARDDTDRFAAVRRWARQHGFPRHVFVKVPLDRKPFYVDFESALYVNMLAKAVRRSAERCAPEARLTVTEMLPQADQAWLCDAEGRGYTSELRMVAVDLRAYAHPTVDGGP
jgi:hypothetical protein